jgi:hypothetical protein
MEALEIPSDLVKLQKLEYLKKYNRYTNAQ